MRKALEILLAVAAGIASFVLSALVGSAARGDVPPVVFGLALLAGVLVVARAAGILYALPVGVGAAQAYDWFFLPPLRDLDDSALTLLGLCIVMAVIVGAVATAAGRRAVESERQLRGLADEQASLRRLALLVAQGEAPELIFAAVTREVLRHFGSGTARMIRYELDGTATLLANEGTAGTRVRVGERWEGYPAAGLTATVLRTGRPARVDDYRELPGGRQVVDEGLISAVGMPIHANGRLWGMITVGTGEGRLPDDTEARMAEFTELVAVAVANAQSRAELVGSRARLVVAADEARRRIERDLHDGAQQRLVALALRLRSAAIRAEQREEVHAEITAVAADIMVVIDELRELSRGIHPAVLSDSGLRPALRALGRRSPVPVEVDVRIDGRLPQPVEIGAYFVVSEVLTNAVKHAGASVVEVEAVASDGVLCLRIHDDGAGGADPSRGSGLLGLKDRVEALGGTFELRSPPGGGTTITSRVPLAPETLGDRTSG